MKERYQNKQLSSLDQNEIVRPFASGSRQAPDPFDFYLDENGFYRKHTARDSSCLFRVISEQVYGIQNYHHRVRQECVDFMKKNSGFFQKNVKDLGEDFDDYLMDMSKPKGRGGRLELRAAGMLYKSNVLIFEPYMRGKYLFTPNKNFTRVIRVFYTAPMHYDSVYTKNYIEKAAYCQAMVYEILYEKVFKLPDVKYAIERMLHDPTGKSMEFHETQDGDSTALTEDGREFVFDKAEGTNCVLGDYKLCHFHNESGFSAEIEKVHEQDQSLIEVDTMPKTFLTDYFLYDPKISCVRQLLEASIAPFPYKVAKALDTSIYRNIEFDSWADWRRELKFKNWCGRGNQLMVGCKSLLRRYDAYGEFYDNCIIKEISKDKRDALVLVEETGEKIFVPYASLKPLKPSNYEKLERSYNVQNLSRRFFSYNNKNQQVSIKSFKHQETTFKRGNLSSKYSSLVKCGIEIDRIGDNFEPLVQEIIAIPMMFNNKKMIKADPHIGEKTHVAKSDLKLEESPNITFLQDTDNDTTDLQKILHTSHNHTLINIGKVSPFDGKRDGKPIDSLVLGHKGDLVNAKINYNACKSEKSDGSDLPTDMATLRFFYNTGIETFKNSKTVGHIAMQFTNLAETTVPATPQSDMNHMVKSFEKLKTDDNNNTPTTNVVAVGRTTSGNYSNSSTYQGNNDYHNRRGMKRRPFGSNNNNGRAYHNSGTYHGGHRNNIGYQNNRHGGNYHQASTDYGRNHNHESSYKGSTTPTSVVSQHSSVCHDSGVVNDSQNGVSNEYPQQTSLVEYGTSNTPQTPQYSYASNVYQQQEYDQANYCAQVPVSCYYPQPSSVPNTPHLMIPTPDMNPYIYNPNSAPVDGSGGQLVEPVYQPYMHPYYYSAPVQAPPMGYFAYYPTTPMGYNNASTSPQVAPMAPVISNMANLQQ